MKKKMAAFWIAFGITAGTTALELSPIPSFLKTVIKQAAVAGVEAIQTPPQNPAAPKESK